MIYECRVYRPNKDGILKHWTTHSEEKLRFIFRDNYKPKKMVRRSYPEKKEVNDDQSSKAVR